MGHELRTPLNGIIGCVQELHRNKALNQYQERAVTTIHNSGMHLLDIINDILDYAKTEAGKVELVPVQFDLRKLIDKLCQGIEYQLVEKQLQFIWVLEENLPDQVEADPTRLRQILYNLLGNALKFTDHGAIGLFVSATTTAKNRVLLSFAVEDTGSGIPIERQDEIFDPFTQTGERLRYAEGSGLGLSISNELVQLMGGTLRVASPPIEPQLAIKGGMGSCFFFSIEVKTSPRLNIPGNETAISVATYADAAKRENLDIPPEPVIAPLLDAARRGDIARINAALKELESSGNYVTFTTAMRRLVEDYRIIQIIETLEKER
ncbi:MAG: ATP-binding protein [Thermodesulfobacteriota bacterium]|nr:ATP-binding protein [Thermodesulfobacteriota bacterium]